MTLPQTITRNFHKGQRLNKKVVMQAATADKEDRLAFAEEFSVYCTVASTICAVMGEVVSLRRRKTQLKSA